MTRQKSELYAEGQTQREADRGTDAEGGRNRGTDADGGRHRGTDADGGRGRQKDRCRGTKT